MAEEEQRCTVPPVTSGGKPSESLLEENFSLELLENPTSFDDIEGFFPS